MALERRLHEKVRNQNGLVYGIGIGGIGNEHITVNSINTSTAPENLEKVVRLAAETSREILNEKKFSQAELDRFKMVNKFGDANWLESVNRRMGKLTDFYRKNKKLYDFYNVLEMERKLTVADVIENSKNYFSAPISVITQGPAFDADLKTVWETAFGGE
jgi:predicted Zn-dependent peptidase